MWGREGQVNKSSRAHTHTHTNTKQTDELVQPQENSMEQGCPSKPKIELPYDSQLIPLLGTYTQTKLKFVKIYVPPVFIPALLTIAKTWKQSRMSISRGMNKETVGHISNGLIPAFTKD